MDRISLRCECGKGHRGTEVMAFIRRSEEECLEKLYEAPIPRTELEIERARGKAGRWSVDNEADKGAGRPPGPQHASEPDRPGPEWQGRDGVLPICRRCGRTPFPDGVTDELLQACLNVFAARGDFKPTVVALGDLIRSSSTQRRP